MAASKKSVMGEFAINGNECAFIAFGSNQGNAKLILEAVEVQMASMGCPILAKASLYATEPWGDGDQAEFTNTVFAISSTCIQSPMALLQNLQAIEGKLGRERDPNRKLGPRTIDLDLLFFGQQTIESEVLWIPHPRLHERRFVLVPMVELAPDFVHPGLKKSCKILLEECYDRGKVEWVGKW